MIIYVNLQEREILASDRQLVTSFLLDILSIVRHGIHLVVMSRHNCNMFRAILADEYPIVKAMLDRMYMEFAQLGKFAINAPIKIEVTSVKSVYLFSDSKYRCGLKNFNDYSFGVRPLLLVEHEINDGDLIKHLINVAAASINLPVGNIEVVHCGGEQVVDIFERKLDQKRIVVCVVDSDKKYPGDGESVKIRKIDKICKNATESIYLLEVLPCHETENLIPLECLEVLSLSPDERRTLAMISKIDLAERAQSVQVEQGYRLYHDFKAGLSYSSYQSFPANRAEYVDRTMKMAGINLRKQTFAPFGGHLCPTVYQCNNSMNVLKSSLENCRYWKSLFYRLFLGISYYFAAAQPKRSF